jgi:hypothetical protein
MTLDQLRIFISYPRGGAAHSWAEAVHACLADLGARVFHDESCVREGDQNWSRTIETSLLSADLVVAIVGSDSEICRWQTRELLSADRLALPVVPLRIAPVALPFCIAEKQPVEARLEQAEAKTLAALAEAIHRTVPGQTARTAPAPTPIDALPAAQRRDELAWLDTLLFRNLSDREALYVPLAGKERRSLSAERAMKCVRMDTDALFRAFGVTREAERAVEERIYADVLDAYRDLGTRPVRRLAVLGEPGAGKSFSLERIAVAYARRARQDETAPIPLLVPLGLWTREDETLESFITRSLGELGRHFPALIAQRRAVLLLDAINEIPPGQRRLKADQIKSLAQDERFASVVVSCREKDFSDFPLPFDALTLQPLTPPRVRDFLHRVVALQRGSAADDGAEARFWRIAGGEAVREAWEAWCAAGAEGLFWTADKIPQESPDVWLRTSWEQYEAWRDARCNPRSLLRLAANPYLLQIMAVLPVIPANRAQLFQGFLEVLYMREARARVARHDARVPTKDVWLAALTKLAEALQTLGQGEDDATEHGAGARTALHRSEWPAALDADLIDFARDASVLDLRADNLRFTHQLLQEYLASRLLLDASRAARPAGDFWPPAHWWERSGWEVVAEIAAEYCDTDSAALTRLIAWLGEANPEVAADIWRHAGQPPLPDELLAGLAARWLAPMTAPGQTPQPRARAAIGRAMGRFGLDQRPGVGLRADGLPDIDWVEVPGPEPFIYQDSTHPGPPTFHIARYPVTHAQFQAFIDAGGYSDERWWRGLAERVEAPREACWSEPNSPRENVSWYEAAAFCCWLSASTAETVSLPTEEQWKRAARGRNRREYPWGKDWNVACANSNESGIDRTTAVGLCPHGESAEGVLDLAGNVWEWCLNEYKNPDKRGLLGDADRVLRGGAWNCDPDYCRAAFRSRFSPGLRDRDVGFRVCRGSPIGPPDPGTLDAGVPGR